MTTFDVSEHPHRRYNPLTGEYVLVSPHRMKRPWQGKQEATSDEEKPQYDPNCYLCPGNTRAGGAAVNDNYTETFVFENDFRSLLDGIPEAPQAENPLFQIVNVEGTNRVICFSPRHDLSLPQLPVADIRKVVDLWAAQSAELGVDYQWVQIFENKGAVMGCSNPHPHGQIWAHSTLPNEVVKEDNNQREYQQQHGSVMLVDYAALESQKQERIVVENEHWLTVVPFWAIWPFETLLLPKRHVLRITDLNDVERDSLSDILKRHLTKYDNLFEISFPYSMGWHGAPFNDADNSHWQLHAHFYPPLLRSATVRKFMVGYEMMAEAQRDLTAEQAADRLRGLSELHYKQG
jgi:UDPglucose--hexose-1-phosphate uridylyltransferase